MNTQDLLATRNAQTLRSGAASACNPPPFAPPAVMARCGTPPPPARR
jgi:hypothetical protein